MDNELYQKKYQYEKLIKDLNNCLVKLENCYSNLILCQKKLENNLKINNKNYYYDDYKKIIDFIENKKEEIRNIILPEAKYEYNNIIYAISKQ